MAAHYPTTRWMAWGMAILGWGLGLQGAPEEPAENWPAIRQQSFEMVWDTVNDAYYDPTFGGVDWKEAGARYRAQLPQVADKTALRQLLEAMLRELKSSHFSILPRDMAVFTPSERMRIGTAGVSVLSVENEVAVTQVSSAAQAAGVLPGDAVVAIDGIELEPLRNYLRGLGLSPARSGYYLTDMVASRLRCGVGSRVRLHLRAPAGGERDAEVVLAAHDGEWSEPMGDFPSLPMECLSRTDENGMGYLRFNVFARQVMKPVRALLQSLPVDGGLVIDLRGNPGGVALMASGISGWLSDRTYSFATMHMRQGHIGYTVFPQAHAFLGPVAILIDGSSASTSEIMAAGLQEAGRARIFGETSPGAALPSVFKALPTGDLFQYVVADIQTPRGILIEGRGVIPDQIILRTRADLAAGRDPVLAAARAWLETQRVSKVAQKP